MTTDSAAIVRQMIDAFNRGDIDAVLEVSSQDFEFDFSNSRGPLSAVYRGREETREFLTAFFEPWSALDVCLTEFIELEDDRVLTVSEIRTRGQGSGAEVNATGAMIWTIGDGVVAAAKMYQSKADALEAAG